VTTTQRPSSDKKITLGTELNKKIRPFDAPITETPTPNEITRSRESTQKPRWKNSALLEEEKYGDLALHT
jgi:hypothetical protein